MRYDLVDNQYRLRSNRLAHYQYVADAGDEIGDIDGEPVYALEPYIAYNDRVWKLPFLDYNNLEVYIDENDIPYLTLAG